MQPICRICRCCRCVPSTLAIDKMCAHSYRGHANDMWQSGARPTAKIRMTNTKSVIARALQSHRWCAIKCFWCAHCPSHRIAFSPTPARTFVSISAAAIGPKEGLSDKWTKMHVRAADRGRIRKTLLAARFLLRMSRLTKFNLRGEPNGMSAPGGLRPTSVHATSF